jgi:hypothetical protein
LIDFRSIRRYSLLGFDFSIAVDEIKPRPVWAGLYFWPLAAGRWFGGRA